MRKSGTYYAWISVVRRDLLCVDNSLLLNMFVDKFECYLGLIKTDTYDFSVMGLSGGELWDVGLAGFEDESV